MDAFLGIDLGSSSVKVSLADGDGAELGSAQFPDAELPIDAPQAGWAEQSPDLWWDTLLQALNRLRLQHPKPYSQVSAIGITYQMHGWVGVDDQLNPLRPSIIWCDGRAVPFGEKAFASYGKDKSLRQLLNSPGNFTAAKWLWVKEHQPEVFDKVKYVMLPGDYLALRLSGAPTTTATGLSEGTLWDYSTTSPASEFLHHVGLPVEALPSVVPSVGHQATVSAEGASITGLPVGTPITYRAGDQPNNALSLGATEAGQWAATAGTSGVVFGLTDRPVADPQQRVNTFVHASHTAEKPMYGVLMCLNGCGILYSWMRRVLYPAKDYQQLNAIAAETSTEGILCYPFGNGAERILHNADPGASWQGLNFNIHHAPHMLRAGIEGIAFGMAYGLEAMRDMGMTPELIRAGRANLFLSPLFRQLFTDLVGARLQLVDTNGALGAARAAAKGAGHFDSWEKAFKNMLVIEEIKPQTNSMLADHYQLWKSKLPIT